MYSYLWGTYFYQNEIIEMIDEVNELRIKKRKQGLKLKTSFAEDLKNKMIGIEEQMEKMLYDSVVDEIVKKNKYEKELNEIVKKNNY